MNELNFITGLLASNEPGSIELAEALLTKSTNATLLKNIYQLLSGLTPTTLAQAEETEKEKLERMLSIKIQLSNRLALQTSP